MEADHHIYMILTKRAARMKHKIRGVGSADLSTHLVGGCRQRIRNWPVRASRSCWRVDTPVRFLSCEPLLEPVSLHHWLRSIAWVIAGGESGPKARKADYDWFRAVRDHCVMANVAFHLKQGNPTRGNRDRVLDGRTWDEFPRVLNDKGELLPPLKKHFGVV